MTWTCPACRTAIQHTEDQPRPGTVYRCHICRLEFVVDGDLGKLTLAPLPTEDQSKERRTAPSPRGG